ncbi:MAG TPA: TAXI family TRAP transporter solute-binding subunit [Chloroflexota bacterium]|nr:TAXI family TRAP transporter solute-binding subunit [Chloroflexota bacterium]
MIEPRWVTPATTRSRIVLEAASELVGLDRFDAKIADVSLRERGAQGGALKFLASDSPAAIQRIASGEAQIGLINPGAPLALAYRGKGPFAEPVPVRAITVLPSYDQLAIAIAERTGLNSLGEIKEKRYPLRVSLRAQPDHSIHLFAEHVFAALGFSLDELRSWGGGIQYDSGFFFDRRLAAVQRNDVDAIMDEAVEVWLDDALDQGLRMLPLEEPQLRQLEDLGYRRAKLSKAEYPKLPADVPTLDFSGWPVFTLASAPNDMVTAFCEALEARKDRIPWEGEGALPLDRMCHDTAEGPLPVPLHPAAQAFWRERGYPAD